MAEVLIKCEICGKYIANKAQKCPHCGASIVYKRKQVIIVIVIIVTIVYIIINYLSGMQDAAIQRARGFY